MKENITIESIVGELTNGMDDAFAGFEYGGMSGADYFRQKLRAKIKSLFQAKSEEITAKRRYTNITGEKDVYERGYVVGNDAGFNDALDQAAAILLRE